MQIRSLETLVRIAQVTSFTEAAALQNMTLPALSMQMKALETELDAVLFDRGFRPPKLTPLGRQVAEQAKTVISQAQTLKNLCLSTDSLMGHFRLGFIQTASVRILPGFILSTQRLAPRATFQYSTALSETLTDQVLNNLQDAAVVTQVGSTDKFLRYDEISSEELALAVPAAYAETPISSLPEQLTFIHFRSTTGIGRLITSRMESLPIRPTQTLVLDGIESIMECVRRGIGYTILPLQDLMRHVDSDVFVHPAASSKLKRRLSLVTRQDQQTDLWRAQLLAIFMGTGVVADYPTNHRGGSYEEGSEPK